jgi:hypothetical protein
MYPTKSTIGHFCVLFVEVSANICLDASLYNMLNWKGIRGKQQKLTVRELMQRMMKFPFEFWKRCTSNTLVILQGCHEDRPLQWRRAPYGLLLFNTHFCYCTTLSVTRLYSVKWYYNRWMINWKGFVRNQWWGNGRTMPTLAWRDREKRRKHRVKMAGLLTEIWTEYCPNMSEER